MNGTAWFLLATIFFYATGNPVAGTVCLLVFLFVPFQR
jgi:hypothetical protein